MCGRVRLSSDVSEIKLVFSIPPHRPTPNIAPSWNVAPTDPLPVVRYDAKAGERSDSEAAHPLARRRTPVFPQTGESHQLPIGQRNRIRLLPGRDLLPLVEVFDGYEAAPPLECLAEGRFPFDPLRFGVDVRETDFDVFRPEGYQPPAHHGHT
jgi:hypothetical protein